MHYPLFYIKDLNSLNILLLQSLYINIQDNSRRHKKGYFSQQHSIQSLPPFSKSKLLHECGTLNSNPTYTSKIGRFPWIRRPQKSESVLTCQNWRARAPLNIFEIFYGRKNWSYRGIFFTAGRTFFSSSLELYDFFFPPGIFFRRLLTFGYWSWSLNVRSLVVFPNVFFSSMSIYFNHDEFFFLSLFDFFFLKERSYLGVVVVYLLCKYL